MKKVIAILIFAALIVSGTACSKTTSGTPGDTYNEAMNEVHSLNITYSKWKAFLSTELFDQALGDYDYDKKEWRPLTDRAYAFDVEVFDIEHMYELFLKGIQSIVPDITITDIKEDLSGITEEATHRTPPYDGTRTVSFKCNGHDYSVTLDSFGDWFNTEMLDRMDAVLNKENCEKQLWVLYFEYDQYIVLVYGSEEDAKKLIG